VEPEMLLPTGAIARLSCFGLILNVGTCAPAQAKINYISKSDAKLLGNSHFLDAECEGTTLAKCKAYVNFGEDCGITGAIGNLSESGPKGRPKKGATFLIADVDNLRARLREYPKLLKALKKWDTQAESSLETINKLYQKVVNIVNGPGTAIDKIKRSGPSLQQADQISEKMAKAAGFEYYGGCGAGEEDSQSVKFVITPKPKSASYIPQMDFDACKRIVKDPYDTNQCDMWETIQPNENALSGRYRYRVIWDDGSMKDGSITALGTSKKTVTIEK
jgi:hypothetical protein